MNNHQRLQTFLRALFFVLRLPSDCSQRLRFRCFSPCFRALLVNFEVKVGGGGLFKTTNGHILRLSVMSVMTVEE